MHAEGLHVFGCKAALLMHCELIIYPWCGVHVGVLAFDMLM